MAGVAVYTIVTAHHRADTYFDRIIARPEVDYESVGFGIDVSPIATPISSFLDNAISASVMAF